MARQLFLHHYLPAHVASSLVTGGLIEFVFSADPGLPPSEPPRTPSSAEAKSGKAKKGSAATAPAQKSSARERLEDQNLLPMWAAAGAILALVISGWWFFLPLTYGRPGLDVAQVNARKWLGYDLHFAK